MQNAANALAAAQANQQTQYNTGAFNATNQQQANMQNADYSQQANMQNAANYLAASQANQQSDLSKNLLGAQLGSAHALQNANMGFNASATNQASEMQRRLANQAAMMDSYQSNQGAYNQAALANQSANLQANLANQSTALARGQSNQDAALEASLANAQYGLQGQQLAMSGNEQLSGLASQATDRELGGMDTYLNAADMVQGMDQSKLDLEYQKWIDEQNYPAQQAGMLQSAFGMVPQLTSTKTQGQDKDMWQGLADTFSDVRLKDNVTKLNGYSYNFKSRPEVVTGGVMAQEVELIAPHLVNTDVETGYKRVNYEALVGVLLEAVKDLKSEVEGLKRG